MVLPEIVAAGIYNSNIVAKNTVISKNRKTSMFEIELPITDGGITYIDSASRPIIPNMIICAKPGQTRHTKFPFQCYYVHMIVHSGVLYDTLVQVPDYFETANAPTYQRIFEELIRHYQTLAELEELKIQSLLLELIYTICNDSGIKTGQSKTAGSGFLIERALNYIKSHLTEDLRLEIVADAMSLSPIHFHNTFKAAVGMTLRDYVEEQRIKKATNLLLSTNDSLTKIAYECGFSSQSYFSFVFKRKMHVTPREYVQAIYNKYEL